MPATAHRTPGETFAGYTQLEALTCPKCGVLHAIPEHMAAQARAKGRRDIYCPNGHTYGWHESDSDRLKRERERSARLLAERERVEASERAQRAAATRARNERNRDRRRVANGVCPCCGRTFKQLARHMSAKHPDYVAESNEAHK